MTEDPCCFDLEITLVPNGCNWSLFISVNGLPDNDELATVFEGSATATSSTVVIDNSLTAFGCYDNELVLGVGGTAAFTTPCPTCPSSSASSSGRSSSSAPSASSGPSQSSGSSGPCCNSITLETTGAFVCDPGAIGTFILAPSGPGEWTDGQHWSIAMNDAGQWRLTPLQSDDEFGWTNGSGPCPSLDPDDWTPDSSESAFCGELDIILVDLSCTPASSSSSAISSSSSSRRSSSSSSSSYRSSSSSSASCQCVTPIYQCSPNLIAGFTTAYDKASNKLFERHLHSECRSHLYPAGQLDSDNRLLQYQRGLLSGPSGASISQPTSLPGADAARSYNLDLMGNWADQGGQPALQWTPSCMNPKTQDRGTNNLNQIATVNGSAPTYDAAGDLTAEDPAAGKRTYAFDAFKRVLSISTLGGTLLVVYAYDAFGRRVLKDVQDLSLGYGGIDMNVPAGATIYLYSGSQIVEEQDEDGTVLRNHVWGHYVDEKVQQREFTSGTKDYYPLSDLLYRSVALTDVNQCIVEAYDTDAYGRTTVFCGPGPDGNWFTDDDVTTQYIPGIGSQRAVPINCHIFTGREYDAETRLYYFRARYYQPEYGRFVSRDRAGAAGGVNLYAYADGNPTISVDPGGLQATQPAVEERDPRTGLRPSTLAALQGVIKDAQSPNRVTGQAISRLQLSNEEALQIMHMLHNTDAALPGTLVHDFGNSIIDSYVKDYPQLTRQRAMVQFATEYNVMHAKLLLLTHTDTMFYLYARLLVPTSELIGFSVMAPACLPSGGAQALDRSVASVTAESERNVARASFWADAWKLTLQQNLRSDVEALAMNVNTARAVAGAVDWRTETTYFGYSGGSGGAADWRALPSELSEPAFQGVLRVGTSRTRFSILNCAAFKVSRRHKPKTPRPPWKCWTSATPSPTLPTLPL